MSMCRNGLTSVRFTAIFVLAALKVTPMWGRAISKETASPAQGPQTPYTFRLEILRQIPHENKPFTQGLEIHADGHHLVETSGAYPPGTESYIRVVDPLTGATVQSTKDGLQSRFVEGITRRSNGRWFASTYNEQKAIEYDDNMKMVTEHTYPHTGWGLALTPNGDSFLATNGSDVVLTLDKDFNLKDAKVVTCLGKRVTGMNELELVEDFAGIPGKTLLGNLYLSRLVLAINPETAECIGTFSLDDLGGKTAGESAGFHAANGLAYNATSKTLWTTGKNWDAMYEVRVTADPQRVALGELSQHLMTALPEVYPALVEVSSAAYSSAAKGVARKLNLLTRSQPLPN